MRKFILLFTVFMTFFTTTTYGEEKKELSVVSQGAILMDAKTGRVLWEKNSTEPLAMASTTKIMTAIVALENGNLDDVVKVSRVATQAPQVKMNLSVDEEITLRDLLYALMLQSYNDSAIAIAEHISGDVDTFCDLMTQRAKELGATDTVFRTPNGLDLDDHHSTAYDMALITRYALNNGHFMVLINTPSRHVETNKGSYDLNNKNRLLNEFSGANGVKTGFTGKAGQCFVGSAVRDDMQLISVVLASGWGNQGKEQKWIDTKNILNYGFDSYSYKEIIAPMELNEKIAVSRSKTEFLDLYIDDEYMLPLTEEEYKSLRVETTVLSQAEAPIEANAVMGDMKIYLGNDLIKEIEIKTSTEAKRHDLETSVKKVISNWLNMTNNGIIQLD